MAIGVKHCLYDPPLQQALAKSGKKEHNGQSFVDLAQTAKCDVISLMPLLKAANILISDDRRSVSED